MSWPKFRVLISFLFKLVKVTGVLESIRIAATNTSSSELTLVESVCFSWEKAPQETRKKKIDTIPFYDNLDAEDIVPSSTTDITDVLFTLDNWNWDEKLFYLKYIEEELSLRKFALKYHYDYNWVYRTLKELKERLKQIKD